MKGQRCCTWTVTGFVWRALAVFALASTQMGGCGGGGDSSSTQSTPQPTTTPAPQNTGMPQNNDATYTFTVTVRHNLTLQPIPGASVVIWEKSWPCHQFAPDPAPACPAPETFGSPFPDCWANVLSVSRGLPTNDAFLTSGPDGQASMAIPWTQIYNTLVVGCAQANDFYDPIHFVAEARAPGFIPQLSAEFSSDTISSGGNYQFTIFLPPQ